MTLKEKIKEITLKSIADMVSNPFEYCGDRSEESDAMASLTLGVVYGILILEENLEKEMCEEID